MKLAGKDRDHEGGEKKRPRPSRHDRPRALFFIHPMWFYPHSEQRNLKLSVNGTTATLDIPANQWSAVDLAIAPLAVTDAEVPQPANAPGPGQLWIFLGKDTSGSNHVVKVDGFAISQGQWLLMETAHPAVPTASTPWPEPKILD